MTSPAPREIWEDLVTSDPDCLIFQTPAWTDAICSSGPYEDASRLYEGPSGRRWLLPLIRSRGALPRLSSLSSLPGGCGLGGLIANTPLTGDLLHPVFTDLEQDPAVRALIRPNPVLSSAWEAAKPGGTTTLALTTHLLDLSGGFEVVWRKRFHHSTRSAVNKAERSGLAVTVARDASLLPAYYDIFLQWTLRRAAERHLPGGYALWMARRRDPLLRLQKMVENSGGSARVYVASLDGRPVAAAILFLFKQNAVYLRGTSIREIAGPVRANDLLQSSMIREACDAGCRRYHMGTSAGVESLMRFKHSFGAEPSPLYNYSIERLPIGQIVAVRNSLLRGIENQLIRMKI